AHLREPNFTAIGRTECWWLGSCLCCGNISAVYKLAVTELPLVEGATGGSDGAVAIQHVVTELPRVDSATWVGDNALAIQFAATELPPVEGAVGEGDDALAVQRVVMELPF